MEKMKINSLKPTKIVLAIALGFAMCFAQGTERLAVYVSGASDAGINKSLSSKLLVTMVQSGTYTEIGDPSSFQDELLKTGKSDLASIIQVAKRYGTDYVCAVSITEVFGTHSISARLIKIAGAQVVKTGLADRSLKSLEDLTAVSNELAMQLLPSAPLIPVEAAVIAPPPAMVPPPPPVAFAPPQQDTVPPLPPPPPPPPSLAAILAPDPVAAVAAPVVAAALAAPAPVVAATQNQCAKTYNINELLSKIKDSFPTQLKDCSSKLAKDMLTPASFGGKKLEPKSFMVQCPIDGIKKELPEGFPGLDKVIGSLTNFVQGIMNAALAGGALDPKKLISAVASMNITGLLNDVKSLSANQCVVDEPYNTQPPPPISAAQIPAESGSSEENGNSAVSFGIRAGINFSHTYAEYDNLYNPNSNKTSGDGDYGDIFGMQFGFVLDLAANEVFHIQPGIMYIQKGMYDYRDVTAHYIEIPLLISLKFAVFRINAGPYLGLCVDGSEIFDDLDLGLSMGLGFDIGMFYIGTFYDYGIADISNADGNIKNFSFYNRTLGFNLGINL